MPPIKDELFWQPTLKNCDITFQPAICNVEWWQGCESSTGRWMASSK